MSEPSQPELLLPASPPLAGPRPPLANQPDLQTDTQLTEEVKTEFVRLYNDYLQAAKEENYFLPVECVNALVANYHSRHFALFMLELEWKEHTAWPEWDGPKHKPDYTNLALSAMNAIQNAVWEAKTAGIPRRRLFQEVAERFPDRTPAEIKAFRLAALQAEAQKLKDKLEGRRARGPYDRDPKAELDQVEEKIRKLEATPVEEYVWEAQLDQELGDGKGKRDPGKHRNPLTNRPPVSAEEHAARVAADQARLAAAAAEREAARAAQLEKQKAERAARAAAMAAKEKARIEQLSPEQQATFTAAKARAKRLMAEERARLRRNAPNQGADGPDG